MQPYSFASYHAPLISLTRGAGGQFVLAALCLGLLLCGLTGVLVGPVFAAVALTAMSFGASLAAALMRRGYPHRDLGLCNLVTLLRLALTSTLVAALVVSISGWIVLGIALFALALDGIDGWLARLGGHVSDFGARFDMAALGDIILSSSRALELGYAVTDQGDLVISAGGDVMIDLLGAESDPIVDASSFSFGSWGRPDPLDTLSVAEFVSKAEDRVSIIGVDYCYLRTSAGNAKFYDTEPDRLHGRHVGEIIGERRFETRARARLDACFRGHVQDYTHTLEVWRDNRSMNGRMTPGRGRNDALIGAHGTKRDVTSLYLGEEQIAP